jgi:hypothetical protein
MPTLSRYKGERQVSIREDSTEHRYIARLANLQANTFRRIPSGANDGVMDMGYWAIDTQHLYCVCSYTYSLREAAHY